MTLEEFNKLVSEKYDYFLGFIHNIVKGIDENDAKDILSKAVEGFIEKEHYKKHDPALGSSAASWFTGYIKFRILQFVEGSADALDHVSRRFDTEGFPAERPETLSGTLRFASERSEEESRDDNTDEGGSVNFEQKGYRYFLPSRGEEGLEHAVAEAMATLRPEEQYIAEAMRDGIPEKEIAESMQLSRDQVARLKRKVKDKLAHALRAFSPQRLKKISILGAAHKSTFFTV